MFLNTVNLLLSRKYQVKTVLCMRVIYLYLLLVMLDSCRIKNDKWYKSKGHVGEKWIVKEGKTDTLLYFYTEA